MWRCNVDQWQAWRPTSFLRHPTPIHRSSPPPSPSTIPTTHTHPSPISSPHPPFLPPPPKNNDRQSIRDPLPLHHPHRTRIPPGLFNPRPRPIPIHHGAVTRTHPSLFSPPLPNPSLTSLLMPYPHGVTKPDTECPASNPTASHPNTPTRATPPVETTRTPRPSPRSRRRRRIRIRRLIRGILRYAICTFPHNTFPHPHYV